MIKKVQTEKLEKAGYKNIVNNSISDSTLMNYSALLALCNHVADELRFLQDSDSLLPPNPYNFFQCTRFPMREGAYLYYDGNKGSFIRSGKVTRRGFAVRGKEHFDESKKVKSSTHFYDLYPSNSCPRTNKRGINGTFKNLQMIVGAGWDPTSSCAKMLDRSWENGGLLIVNERESAQIRGSMGKGTTEIEKFHDMCAYQFEMGYDLAISPGCNVSRSPGFESVLGIYGGQE